MTRGGVIGGDKRNTVAKLTRAGVTGILGCMRKSTRADWRAWRKEEDGIGGAVIVAWRI